MKKVLILNTGGTICMTAGENGYVPDKERFLRSLHEMPELRAPDMPAWEMISLDPLIDSSNMTVDDWNRIARKIAERYDAFDGFVVLHGTDTMAYTASALSFMLENLSKPVVLTGAQIPLCQLRSDGKDNLITSLIIAGGGKVNEVCIYFGGELLRGCRAMKYSSDGFIAFKSPNFPPLARAGIAIEYNDALLLPKPEKPFSLQILQKHPIGVIKVFPGIQFELFEGIMTESLKAVVIETFGAGNVPGSARALLPVIQKAARCGTVIVICTQCPQGTVSLGAYETSAALKRAGAVSGRNMTTEAAVCKLYYLLSKNLSPAELRRQLETSLCGEE